MAADKVIQFDDIYFNLQPEPGQLRLARGGLGWKPLKSISGEDKKKMVTVAADELQNASWLRAARNYEMRLHLLTKTSGKTMMRFSGFRIEDFEILRQTLKGCCQLTLESKELSLKGWNWGRTEFQGDQLVFNVTNKTMFELPLAEVSNTNISGKNEVSVEFAISGDREKPSSVPEGGRRNAEDELVEMRFYIPNNPKYTVIRDRPVSGDGQEEDEEKDTSQLFYETIKERADLGKVSGDYIAMFSEVLFVTPRGRYDIELYKKFLRLRGKSYDYKVMYEAIVKLFLLPKNDDIHVQLVIGLDPPLRQGQTRYPFLVTQFVKDDESHVSTNLDDKTNSELFKGKIEREYEGATFEIVANLVRALSGRKITIPGSYRSKNNACSVKCSLKASEGHLYPLDKCLLFIPKPTIFIPHSEIANVIFSRMDSASLTTSRTFDLKFNLKTGHEHQFSGVNRDEYANLEVYLREYNVKIRNELTQNPLTSFARLSESSSYETSESDSDADAAKPDKRRKKDEAAAGESAEESDGEFVDNGEESDVAEEYDEDYVGGKSSGSE